MSEPDVSIRAVRAGAQYRVRTATGSYLLALNPDSDAVFVYSANACHGGFLLSRFGGVLSPASIREFLRATPAVGSPCPPPMSIVESEEVSEK